MSRSLLWFMIVWLLQGRLTAVDWAEIAAQPAGIQAVQMKPVPLETSAGKKGWLSVPASLTQHRALIFTPLKDQLGSADIEVTQTGYLLLACNFDYQGNDSGGDWVRQRWDERRFKLKGWKPIKPSELTPPLIQNDKRAQTLFYKKVTAGERLLLRCNKYDPPYPIVLQ